MATLACLLSFVIVFAHPKPTVGLLSDCGVTRGCVRAPVEDCEPMATSPNRCVAAVTWQSTVHPAIVNIELVRLLTSSTQAVYTALALSADQQMGLDAVVACVFDPSAMTIAIKIGITAPVPNVIPERMFLQHEQLGYAEPTGNFDTVSGQILNGYLYCRFRMKTTLQLAELGGPFNATLPYYYLLAAGKFREGLLMQHSINKSDEFYPTISSRRHSLTSDIVGSTPSSSQNSVTSTSSTGMPSTTTSEATTTATETSHTVTETIRSSSTTSAENSQTTSTPGGLTNSSASTQTTTMTNAPPTTKISTTTNPTTTANPTTTTTNPTPTTTTTNSAETPVTTSTGVTSSSTTPTPGSPNTTKPSASPSGSIAVTVTEAVTERPISNTSTSWTTSWTVTNSISATQKTSTSKAPDATSTTSSVASSTHFPTQTSTVASANLATSIDTTTDGRTTTKILGNLPGATTTEMKSMSSFTESVVNATTLPTSDPYTTTNPPVTPIPLKPSTTTVQSITTTHPVTTKMPSNEMHATEAVTEPTTIASTTTSTTSSSLPTTSTTSSSLPTTSTTTTPVVECRLTATVTNLNPRLTKVARNIPAGSVELCKTYCQRERLYGGQTACRGFAFGKDVSLFKGYLNGCFFYNNEADLSKLVGSTGRTTLYTHKCDDVLQESDGDAIGTTSAMLITRPSTTASTVQTSAKPPQLPVSEAEQRCVAEERARKVVARSATVARVKIAPIVGECAKMCLAWRIDQANPSACLAFAFGKDKSFMAGILPACFLYGHQSIDDLVTTITATSGTGTSTFFVMKCTAPAMILDGSSTSSAATTIPTSKTPSTPKSEIPSVSTRSLPSTTQPIFKATEQQQTTFKFSTTTVSPPTTRATTFTTGTVQAQKEWPETTVNPTQHNGDPFVPFATVPVVTTTASKLEQHATPTTAAELGNTHVVTTTSAAPSTNSFTSPSTFTATEPNIIKTTVNQESPEVIAGGQSTSEQPKTTINKNEAEQTTTAMSSTVSTTTDHATHDLFESHTTTQTTRKIVATTNPGLTATTTPESNTEATTKTTSDQTKVTTTVNHSTSTAAATSGVVDNQSTPSVTSSATTKPSFTMTTTPTLFPTETTAKTTAAQPDASSISTTESATRSTTSLTKVLTTSLARVTESTTIPQPPQTDAQTKATTLNYQEELKKFQENLRSNPTADELRTSVRSFVTKLRLGIFG